MRPCSTCLHPDRAAIDAALATNSYRAVAERYHLSPSSLHRHHSDHGWLLAVVDLTLADIRGGRAPAGDALADLGLFMAEGYAPNAGG